MNVWYETPTIFGIRRVFSGRKAIRLIGALIVVVAFITTLGFNLTQTVSANANRVISFQGKLLNSSGQSVDDGYYNIQFKIYEGGSGNSPGNPGGTLKWSETYINDNSTTGAVKVFDGRFAVELGSKSAFGDSVDWSSNSLWLSMNVAGSAVNCTSFGTYPCADDGEMIPMKQLTATPYAMSAGSVGGKSVNQLLHLGQNTQTDSSNNSSISIDKIGSGNLIDLKNGGNDVFKVTGQGDIALGNGSDHTLSVEPSTTDEAGRKLTISAGNGGAGTGSNGGNLSIEGGSGGGTNGNGGNITISGGAGTGTGASGLVVINTPAFATVTNDANCYTDGAIVDASCTVLQSSIDNAAAVIVGFSQTEQTANIPDPSITTAGRIMYITASNGSKQFNLSLNGGSTETTMRPNSTITLFWNGSDWTLANNSITSDRLSINDDETEEAPNVKIGSKDNEDTTLLTVDKSTSAPVITDENLLGSIYYDTTIGKMQCYEAEGWGDCASSPDKFISLSPEYTNAVTNGSTLGTLKSDFCSDTLGINNGTNDQAEVCGNNETQNFYNWTSSEASAQTKSIYVNYQLPSNFKEFIADSTSLSARTDSLDASVSYDVYRSSPSTGMTLCGTTVNVSTGPQSLWQKSTASGSNDPANCSFTTSDSIVIKINMTASNDANAYVGNLNFAYK